MRTCCLSALQGDVSRQLVHLLWLTDVYPASSVEHRSAVWCPSAQDSHTSAPAGTETNGWHNPHGRYTANWLLGTFLQGSIWITGPRGWILLFFWEPFLTINSTLDVFISTGQAEFGRTSSLLPLLVSKYVGGLSWGFSVHRFWPDLTLCSSPAQHNLHFR